MYAVAQWVSSFFEIQRVCYRYVAVTQCCRLNNFQQYFCFVAPIFDVCIVIKRLRLLNFASFYLFSVIV